MSTKLLVLLGHTNNLSGELSEIAKSRADLSINLLEENPDCIVIPTGAFGENFNQSDVPHGALLTTYLTKGGVHASRILPFTRSHDTVEDAYDVLSIIPGINGLKEIHIVTSQFHLERTKFIFGRVFQRHTLRYHAAGNPIDQQQLKRLHKRERRSLKRLKNEWVNIEKVTDDTHLGTSYENLGNELRHYDMLSQLSVSGAVLMFGLTLANNFFGDTNTALTAQYLMTIISLLVFGYLYLRLANTAASARRVMIAIERIHRIPGLSSTSTVPFVFGIPIPIPIKRVIGIALLLMIIVLVLKIYLVLRPEATIFCLRWESLS